MKLRVLRQARGYSQQQLAGMAGRVTAGGVGGGGRALRPVVAGGPGPGQRAGRDRRGAVRAGNPGAGGRRAAGGPARRGRRPGHPGPGGGVLRGPAPGRGLRDAGRLPPGGRAGRDAIRPGPGRSGAAAGPAPADPGGGGMRPGPAAAGDPAGAARPSGRVQLVAVQQRRGAPAGRGRAGSRGRRAPARPLRRVQHRPGPAAAVPGRCGGVRVRLLAGGPGAPARNSKAPSTGSPTWPNAGCAW